MLSKNIASLIYKIEGGSNYSRYQNNFFFKKGPRTLFWKIPLHFILPEPPECSTGQMKS